MFPFQQSESYDHLGFRTPTTSQGYLIQQDDPVMDYDFSLNNSINFADTKTRDLGFGGEKRQKESSKKAIHREVEKKRRQEMSHLYASLRSLLPDYQIKGKRGVCDQIEVAENHIKRMEKNIQQLKTRRNKLKSQSMSYSSSERDNNVAINKVSDGMEILVSYNIERSDLGLSQVLAELQRHDVDVVSCVSTRMKDRFVHNIQAKALDITKLSPLVLQEALSRAIM